MAKRSQQAVSKADTGAIRGDGHGAQGIAWVNKGGRNATTNAARRGAGQIAPKPSNSSQQYLGSSSATASSQAGMARVPSARSSATGKSGPAGSFTPVQNNANANLQGTSMPYGGQGTPPAQRGGPDRLRAGGRNQTWPNGPMYTNGVAKGSSGKDSGPVATRKPNRNGGSAFYGDKES